MPAHTADKDVGVRQLEHVRFGCRHLAKGQLLSHVDRKANAAQKISEVITNPSIFAEAAT